MGASGSGKTTVGQALAARLGARFVDADDLHPAANLRKMTDGIPLDDIDRAPWLDAVGAQLAHPGTVVACSALRRAYRDRLRALAPDAAVVHLDAPRDVLAERMSRRAGHFMPSALLDSQLEALEPPAPGEGALIVDATLPVEELVDEITGWLA